MASKDLDNKKVNKTNTDTESNNSPSGILIELPNISLSSISDIKDEITPTVQEIVEKIEEQIKCDINIIEEKVEEVQEVQEELKEVVEEVQEELKEVVKQKVEELKEVVEQQVEEAIVQVEQHVVDEVNTKCKSFAFILPVINIICIIVKTLLKSKKNTKSVVVSETESKIAIDVV